MTAIEEKHLKYLGKRISQVRRAKKMSQLDVCALIDMEKSNLSAIENGRQNVTALTLLKISNAIGVEVKEFYKF
ncbi:helix-turn-helix transcriptional regulator [Winogradskyella sp. SYSU M77433]|uniref:helix-turn-helix domain-containing protein n=1 Tax=Winogradskyella sp. SYSU M77433 TaxID=3042722 RepID=UPI00247FB972|nr:helix-turn-helix transcriptional regulator [Winogradskyella sp. SYSU M77433]MDH7912088.1 helix-turn-helix transcriptional regulator [Winogradskyella sp. SYSU M77433]